MQHVTAQHEYGQRYCVRNFHLGKRSKALGVEKKEEEQKDTQQKTSDTTVDIIQEFLITQALKETLH